MSDEQPNWLGRDDALRERAEIRKVLTDALGPLPTDHPHLIGTLRVRLAEMRLASRAEADALRAFKERVEESSTTDTVETILKRIVSASWTCGRAIAKADRETRLGSRR